MNDGWRHRLVAVLGAAGIATLSVVVATTPAVRGAFRALPVVGHLPFDPPAGAEFAIEAATAVVAIVVALALVAVPAWFVAIRQPYRTGSGRTLLVGDGPVFGNLSADFAV